MQHEASQPVDGGPVPLSYATTQRRSHRLGITGLSCALVSPSIYLLLIILGRMDLHPGYRGAVTMALLAVASAIAAICLSVLSLRRESRNGWATAGLVLGSLALCFNCFALGNA
jgi:hypothetical protein